MAFLVRLSPIRPPGAGDYRSVSESPAGAVPTDGR